MKGKVLIAGGSGLVGSRLTQLLSEAGFEVMVLSRSKNGILDGVKFILWNPAKQELDKEAYDAEYIINLAGAGIADKPWTKSRKKELTDSRLISTNFLLDRFRQNKSSIKTYLGASAIGYYGDGGDTWQEEEDAPNVKSFMTDLCKAWEEVHSKFKGYAESVSILRIGIVLSTLGGAYPKLRLPFKFGVGSYFGSGDQYYSWIHIDDLAQMFIYLLDTNSDHGIYNAVSPNPSTNKELTKSIKKALDLNGLVLPAPSFILKTVMGQMSNVILNSNRVTAKKIEKTGFKFSFPNIKEAIKDIEEHKI